MNRHLSEPMRVLKTRDTKINTPNVNMPASIMKMIGEHLKKKMTELRSQNNTLANRQQLAKCFGQYTLPSHPRLTHFYLFSDLRPAPYGLPAKGGRLHRAT